MKHIIKKGYKLFEMRDDNKLFPLFISKTTETPMHEWVMAEIVEYHPQFAHRPGWHLGAAIPSAPWLMSANGIYKSQRGKRFKRVWCEVEYVADIDYTSVVEKLHKKCFTDRLWLIADIIRVTRILTERERVKILNDMNYNEAEAFEPYRKVMEKRMAS